MKLLYHLARPMRRSSDLRHGARDFPPHHSARTTKQGVTRKSPAPPSPQRPGWSRSRSRACSDPRPTRSRFRAHSDLRLARDPHFGPLALPRSLRSPAHSLALSRSLRSAPSPRPSLRPARAPALTQIPALPAAPSQTALRFSLPCSVLPPRSCSALTPKELPQGRA